VKVQSKYNYLKGTRYQNILLTYVELLSLLYTSFNTYDSRNSQ